MANDIDVTSAQDVRIINEDLGVPCQPYADGHLPVALGNTGGTRINPATEDTQTQVLAGVTGIKLQTDKLKFSTNNAALLAETDNYTSHDNIQFATAQLANNASATTDFIVPNGVTWHLSDCTFSREYTMNTRRVQSSVQVIWDPTGANKQLNFIRTNGPTQVVPTHYAVVGDGVKVLRFIVTNGSEDPSIHNVGMRYRIA